MVRIEPRRSWLSLGLRELWTHRELAYFLVWRDVKVRYKQTLLGVVWVVFQPVLTAVIFALVFGKLAGLPSEGVPYSVVVFTALIPWQFLSGAITRGGQSLVMSSQLLTKIYFPRVLIPVSAVVTGLVDFFISLALLLAVRAAQGHLPGWKLLLLPFLVGLALLPALAVAMWLSALNVRYRDVGYLLPFLAQVWLFVSPVAYIEAVVPAGPLRTLFNLNPMTGVIQCFRWVLLDSRPPDPLIVVSATATLVVLLAGLIYFRAAEDAFADVV